MEVLKSQNIFLSILMPKSIRELESWKHYGKYIMCKMISSVYNKALALVIYYKMLMLKLRHHIWGNTLIKKEKNHWTLLF